MSFDPSVRLIKKDQNVYSSTGKNIQVDNVMIQWLVSQAEKNNSHKCRICLHHKKGSAVQEMVIAYKKGVRLPIHRQLGKHVSYSILAGELELNLYDDFGELKECIPMSFDGETGVRLCRLDASSFRNMTVKSDVVVFHEVANGPFNELDTEWLQK